MCHCCVNEISRRIARSSIARRRRFCTRSASTIRKTPQNAIFPEAAPVIADDERTQIVRLFRRGIPIRTLARRSCRPRSAVYRVVVEERVARLNRRKVKFIDDPLYHQERRRAGGRNTWRRRKRRLKRRRRKFACRGMCRLSLASLCSTPPLTPGRERALFIKLNYHKMRFVTARRKLEPEFASARDLNLLEAHLRKATETKNQILRANLRLIVSVARKHLRGGLSLMELVSDGTMTLMRAIDSFDIHRGNKFSTYATLALMKGFARSVPQMLAKRAAGADPERAILDVADRRTSVAAERFLARRKCRICCVSSMRASGTCCAGISVWMRAFRRPTSSSAPGWGYRRGACGRSSRRRWRSLAGQFHRADDSLRVTFAHRSGIRLHGGMS